MLKRSLLVVSMAAAACSGPSALATGSPAPAVTPTTSLAASAAPASAAASPRATVVATPTTYTSPLYGYSLTLPAGWSAGPAIVRWDGASPIGSEEPYVDKFAGPGSESFFAFAAPYAGTLDAFAQQMIAATARDHGDTCLHPLEVTEPIQIAGQPGVFLAWNSESWSTRWSRSGTGGRSPWLLGTWTSTPRRTPPTARCWTACWAR
jgi:hypothetical protein